MIAAVTDIDLIAKEFSKHQKCYLNYTRIARDVSTENSADSSKNSNICSDFHSVCKVIENLILGQHKCISMETLGSVYGINESDRQQRYRLKQQLSNKYKGNLLFISYEKHSPQLVIRNV